MNVPSIWKCENERPCVGIQMTHEIIAARTRHIDMLKEKILLADKIIDRTLQLYHKNPHDELAPMLMRYKNAPVEYVSKSKMEIDNLQTAIYEMLERFDNISERAETVQDAKVAAREAIRDYEGSVP